MNRINEVKDIQLSNGFTMSVNTYMQLQALAEVCLLAFSEGETIKCRDLFGEEFWMTLPDHYTRRLVGRGLAHMVAHKKMNLDFLAKRGTNKIYTVV